MKKLPAEVLTEIFLHLHQDAKMECMLVCHHWRQIIAQSVLYHTFCIYSADALHKLTRKIQQQVDIKNKVEQLMIFLGPGKGALNLEKLLPLLPNMKVLLCSNWEEGATMTEEEANYPWRDHIQHISEHSDYRISYRLLSSGVCHRLTTLEVSGHDEDIIPILVNAPVLEDLSIIKASIGFDDLEFIHNNLSRLKSLELTYLNLRNSELGNNIKPATAITECVFDLLQAVQTKERINLLVYIHKKYPNISKLTYNIDIDRIVDSDIEKINKLGWTTLFNKLGHQLKKLCIDNGGYITNLFETLDKADCQIEYLKITNLPRSEFTKIDQSKQILYIKTLMLIHIELDSFTWLKELKVLEKLHLFWNYLRAYVKLNDILDNSPAALRSLSFDYMDLTVDLNYNYLSNVEKLSFYMVSLPKNLDVFISRHFPKLSTLKLKHCNLIKTTFDLSPMNLSSFHFTDQYQNAENIILIISSGKKEQHWYSLKGETYNKIPAQHFKSFHHLIYPPIKTCSVTSTIPDFTLICNSVGKLVFS